MSLTASKPTVTGPYDVPAVRFELVILIHHRPSAAQTLTHHHQVAMASSAIAPCCTASRPSLKSSTRHSFAASRLPARRPQSLAAIAAKQSNKVRELQMARVKQFSILQQVIKLSCVAAGVKPMTPRSLVVGLIYAELQVQVAAAATALSTLAIAVAPAAQAAQEAFVVAEVRKGLYVLLLAQKATSHAFVQAATRVGIYVHRHSCLPPYWAALSLTPLTFVDLCCSSAGRASPCASGMGSHMCHFHILPIFGCMGT